MGLFIDCHFLFEVQLLCLSLHIVKFCHLKIVSGVVDARIWSAKWRNWNISDIFFSEFSRVTKAEEVARNICAEFGVNSIGNSTARKWFSRLMRIVLALVTLHIQEDLRV